MNLKKTYHRWTLAPWSLAAFLKKDYTLLFRRKKYIYLSLALPIFIALIYIFSISDNPGRLHVLVCDHDNTTLTQDIVTSMSSFRATRSTDPNCVHFMKDAIRDRDYLFGIVLEKGFTNRVEDLQQNTILVYYDNSDPSIALLASWKVDVALAAFEKELTRSLAEDIQQKSSDAQDELEIAIELADQSNLQTVERRVQTAQSDLQRLSDLDPDYVADPIITTHQGVHPTFAIIDVAIAPLFAVLALFLVTMLSATGIIYDRKTGVFSRIRASNASMYTYLLSKLIFFTTIICAQFIVVLLLFLAFGAHFSISFLLLIKALVFIALTDTLLGLLIGILSDSEGIAVLISLIITLPLLFLSGMFYPLELLPQLIQWISLLIPLHIQVDLLHQAMLFGAPISNVVFIIPAILFAICTLLLRRRT